MIVTITSQIYTIHLAFIFLFFFYVFRRWKKRVDDAWLLCTKKERQFKKYIDILMKHGLKEIIGYECFKKWICIIIIKKKLSSYTKINTNLCVS